MNFVPSRFSHSIDSASLSKPGFDILLAVSDARQSALPTVRMLRARANHESHVATIGALREILLGTATRAAGAVRPARFFDLSDKPNSLSESMNSLFTRGFQSMLNPSVLKTTASVNPIPPDVETME